MTRREWIRAVGGTAVMLRGAVEPVRGAVETLRPEHCLVLDQDGEPVPAGELARFYICDLLLRPFPIAPIITNGAVTFEPPNKPFRIAVPLRVPGFGHVFVYADNQGVGYTRASLAKSGELLLNYEFARDRLVTVRTLLDNCRELGVTIPPAMGRRIEAAAAFLGKAETRRQDRVCCARLAMKSLCESLWAGESLVFELAKFRIAKQPPRPGFLFGAFAERFATGPDWYREYYTQLLNYATIPFYRDMVEKVRGVVDYSRPEAILKAMQNTSLMVKGHPLIFLTPGATPAWLKNLPFDETQALCVSRVRDVILRFRNRVHVWDVINEAHVQPDEGKLEMTGFTREGNVEMTVSALRAAHVADPTCFRVVNNTGTWCDYYMGRKPWPWQQSVYDYLTMLKDAGAEYEAVGLQYYSSGRDMVEFERNLETFKTFGRRVHITELGYSSSSASSPEDVRENTVWWGGGVGGAKLVWHGEKFTEASQADWYEQVYTIAYSKLWVDAISMWDFSDPAFIPHGGIVSEDGTPKESYRRLQALLAKWRRPI
jgi:endo-1,4-beta-xylanase